MSQLFFPGEDATISLLKAFAVFGVGFVMRPVGSILFGIYGDRYGRRLALSAVIFLMAFSTLAIDSSTGMFWCFGTPVFAGRPVAVRSAAANRGARGARAASSAAASYPLSAVLSAGVAALSALSAGAALARLSARLLRISSRW
jgi:MFS family permease